MPDHVPVAVRPEGAEASLPPRSLARLCRGRDNNLNLMRMIAASAVLVSHSFPISYGPGAAEPLEGLTGHSLGWLAVAIFFTISGFLIARSFERAERVRHWFAARAFRLYPALLGVLVLTVVVLGPAVTVLPLSEYAARSGTWSYIPRNLSLAFLQYPLPGVFHQNAYQDAINGSLWTLVYEVACYGGVLLAGAAGLLRRPRAFAMALVFFLAGYAAVITGGPYEGGVMWRLLALTRLALPFALGMAGWVWRDRIVLDGRIAVAGWLVCAGAWFTPVFTPIFLLAIAYSVAWLAYVPRGILLRYNELGDYSYGVYLYAFPVQQTFAYLFPGSSWLANVAWSWPVTLLFAVLSWHAIEKRALAFAKPGGPLWRRGGAPVGIAPAVSGEPS